ncbi:hypothetical protein [Propioniciclava tarda]|uniref:Uncharacterized protein n=1 Tax=Propioniciclava tarda TaxID=433330 RepID=A0A4Q9KKQ3_PROTD|nr:hypothetical protein [Propioniciclava tarda]TBT95043.1 hypothetical protein ET996_07155 [Propioniciclava tarda]SMO54364.1 hypothetical protein SAMN06266982_10637 [Propioniciclava tarda]
MLWTRQAAAVAVTALLAGCVPANSAPLAGSPSAGSTFTPTPSASPTSDVLDFTQPGVAKTMIRDLVRASSSTQVIMVSVRQHEATVSVLRDGKPYTWAYREGLIRQIDTDLVYVGQVTFSPDAFDLSDVGKLFKTASYLAGSSANQELQIIDLRRVEHAASELKMSVSTNPETRTVFFDPDGTPVREFNFNTAYGITEGLAEALGSHTSATTVSVSSAAGAYIEYPGEDGSTIVRRERRPRFPVLDASRSGNERLPPFDPRTVSGSVIWSVLQRQTGGTFGADTVWSVVADARDSLTAPRLYFTIKGTRLVTDLTGNEIKP